jgi:hypothetical protein
MRKMRNAYKILVGKPEWTRPLERRWLIWQNSIKIVLREIGFEDVDWIFWIRIGTDGMLL